MAPIWDWEKEAKLASTSTQDTALCIAWPEVDTSIGVGGDRAGGRGV